MSAASASRASSCVAGRQAGHDARVLDHVRTGGAAPPNRGSLIQAVREGDRERRVERVAGAGRVDDRCGERRHDLVAEPRALLAEGQDDRAGRATDRPRLGLVRRAVVGDGQHVLGQHGGRSRRGVQHRPDAGLVRDLERAVRRRHRDLQLDEQHICRGDPVGERVDVRGASADRAPGTIAIRLSPVASTRIAATIVGRPTRTTAPASTPSSAQSSKAPSPN